MTKKKTRKPKAAKSIRDLPQKGVKAKTAKAVKGGDTAPTESISFTYGGPKWQYTK